MVEKRKRKILEVHDIMLNQILQENLAKLVVGGATLVVGSLESKMSSGVIHGRALYFQHGVLGGYLIKPRKRRNTVYMHPTS